MTLAFSVRGLSRAMIHDPSLFGVGLSRARIHDPSLSGVGGVQG